MTKTERAEKGRAAIEAGASDPGAYIKDAAVDAIANILAAYGDSWGARLGDALAEDVFEQALATYKAAP